MKRSLAGIALLLWAGLANADFNTGVFAYINGQYDVALDTMRSLAETTDHAYAQYYLGMMYANGQGVDPDEKEAAKWFMSAAKQGISQAQYRVAEMFEQGRGMPRDFENAYAWYAVAAKLGNKEAPLGLGRVAAKLSDEQLEEAQALARQYVDDYGKRPEGTKQDR
jgi:TPR repeat protein